MCVGVESGIRVLFREQGDENQKRYAFKFDLREKIKEQRDKVLQLVDEGLKKEVIAGRKLEEGYFKRLVPPKGKIGDKVKSFISKHVYRGFTSRKVKADEIFGLMHSAIDEHGNPL